ncbi:MAG: acyltransferase [Prevotella sp.]|nr:acyltransferase [Prevotella sp.]
MEELDFLKCVFITLMIAFHLVYIGNTYPVAKQLVYTFHMPGFLLISGYLFNIGKPPRSLARTLLWIFIPYAVMETGYTVMASLLPIREHIDNLTLGLMADHVLLHPMGPYWYLHTLMLCGASYYAALHLPRLSLFSRFLILALLLWLLADVCGLVSLANAGYFLAGAVVRQAAGDFRRVFPASWLAAVPLVLLCADTGHYDRATPAGMTIVYLVICVLMWVWRLPFRSWARHLFLYIGRNTFPLLLFSPVFTVLAKVYQPLLIRMEPSGMLFLVVSVTFAICGSFGIKWVMDRLRLSRYFFGK